MVSMVTVTVTVLGADKHFYGNNFIAPVNIPLQ